MQQLSLEQQEAIILQRIAPELKQLLILHADREGSLAQARVLVKLLPNKDTCVDCRGTWRGGSGCGTCAGKGAGAWLKAAGLEKLALDLGLKAY